MVSSVNTVYLDSESNFCYGPSNWEIVPVKINESISLNRFKKEIINRVPRNLLRKEYVSGVGFLP